MKKLEKDVVDMKTKKPIEPTTRQVKSQPKRAASVGDPEHMRSKMTDVQAKTPPAARTTPSQQLWGKNKTPDDSDAKIRAALDRQAKAKPDLGKSDEKGVHQDTEHKGKSLAGLKTDASNSRKATNQKGDKAIAAAWNSKAKDDHKKVLSEMKAMPKPDLGKSDYHKRDEGVNKQASGPDKKGVSEAGVYVRGGDKQRAKIEHEKTRAEQKYMDKPDLGKSDDTSKIAKPDHITDSTWKNSGQQGHHPDHADNPHHDTLTRHGYKYSHSTPTTRQDGTKYTHHTYKKGNHNVGIDRASGSWKWNAGRTGSGTTYHGRDDKQLDKYLKGHGARNKTPNLGKSLEKSLTTPAHSAHGKLAAMLSKLRGTSLDKSEDDQDPASAHLAEIVQTLDDCLRTCTDEQAQEKISLAKDYLSALMAHLQYEPEMHSALTDLMHNGPESKGV